MAALNGRKKYFIWVPVIIVIAVGLVLMWPLRHRDVEARSPYLVGTAAKGATLFFGDKQCGICHAVNGSGGHVAPDLSGMRPESPAMGWMVTVLWNHGPGMWRQIRRKNKPYPELSSQEMADILAFLYQASSVEPKGNASAGQRVFQDKGCVRCHSVRGAGGTTAPDLSAIAGGGDSTAWTRAMLNHAGSMITPISSTIGQWPQFSGSEMNELIAYASAPNGSVSAASHASPGNPEQGWGVFQKRCMGCHAVRGKGGTLGPELGPEHELPLSTAQFASLMWNHEPAMYRQSSQSGIAPPQLQENEMADLLAFLASIRYFEPSGSAASGKQVFSQRGCAACHGPDGEGTSMGPPLNSHEAPFTAISLTASLWRHGPKMVERAEEMGLSWPTLKATDVGDLVSFLNQPVQPK